MMKVRRLFAALLCVAALGAVTAGPALAAAPEPDALLSPPLVDKDGTPLALEGPCGLAVGDDTQLFVANHYPNKVDWVKTAPELKIGLAVADVDPLGGPCGLALEGLGRLYVNNYHRNVERYLVAGGSFQVPAVIDSGDPGENGVNPTGVAVDTATNDVYVDNRTHITAYDSTGAPLMDDGEPLAIGQGSLGDGYGIAISGFPGPAEFPSTARRIDVPDYADNTVKVYAPAVDVDDPVQVIDGAGIPGGGFGSLRDSAVAVDRVTGEVYVADTLAHPQHTEYPEAVIRVFGPDGAYKGRLKYAVIDGSPVGLAVDNTVDQFGEAIPTQGRVYVTSGNTVDAVIYIYPPGSVTSQSAPPLIGGAPPAPGGGSTPAGGSPDSTGSVFGADAADASATTQPKSAHPSSVIEQRGNLRVTVEGRLRPRRLPRKGSAPIKVSVGGQIATTDRSLPPQLKTLQIELNRHGRLERAGLPSCRYEQIQPGSSKRALSACRSSLVGTGSFEANIILAGQEPYPSRGRLLVFNATEKGKPVLYGHIHTARPFATSFVIVFELREKRSGRYGTTLFARIPRSMDSWGRLTALEMTLGRTYRAKGKRRAYISAGCPAPAGFPGTLFPLARTTFAFKGGKRIASTLISECMTRR